MTSAVAHRNLEDALSNTSSLQDSRHSALLDQSDNDAPDYSQSPYYSHDMTRSSSSEVMLSITPDDDTCDQTDISENPTDDTNDTSKYGTPTMEDGVTHDEARLLSLDSAHSANPDPPVLPGRSVMIAKGNVINNSQRGSDKKDGTDVYRPTTEPVEKERSCCLLFKGRGKKKKNPKRVEKTPNEEPSKDKRKQDIDPVKSKLDYGAQEWLLLFVLLSGTLTSSFAVCLFPPFFPKIAQQKGATATIFGLIIGTNCLAAFLFTPIIGKKLSVIGVKFAFTAGLFCSGGCCVLSGFLEWFPGGPIFVILAILIRMTHAIANAGISTSTFAYIATEFPENVAKIFAISRTTMNVAQMLGPVVGGALYAVGGFKMPFLVMGSIQMAMTLLAVFYLKEYKEKCKNPTNRGKTEIEITKLFAIPGIWVSFLTFVFSTMSNGFLSVTLEPLVLRKFNLGPLYVGLLFGLKDGANSIASPAWGWVCDKYRKVKIFILMASCLAFMSFVLLGPLPGLPLKSTLWLVILALTLNGFGIGGQQVAGVVDAMREAVGAGFPDEAGTHGCVAGLWASLSGAGRFTSRAGTGILVDHIGFRDSSVVIVALHGCIILITLLHLMFCKEGSYRRHRDIENAQDYDSTMVVDGRKKLSTVFTTSPSDPVTTKAVQVDIPNYREDIEDSIFCGTSPIPTPTRYARESCMRYGTSDSSS